jgi:DNA-binding CsgD family transcriptional regulator
MWEEQAHRTRREVAALAASGLGVRELYPRAMAAVQAVVPNELTCWAVLDPETTVISAMVSGPVPIPPEYEPRLAIAEYTAGEPHSFAELARRREAVTPLSDLDAAERARSLRLNTVWRPLGLDQEVRVLFLTPDGTAWGGAGIVRQGRAFTPRELEYLAGVAPVLATATRLAVRAEVTGRHPAPGPAVAVIGPDGALRSATAGARMWQERFDELAPGRFRTVLRLMLSGMTSSASGVFEARLRDGTGAWAVLRATPLLGDEGGDTAVTIEPADARDLLQPMLHAFGLTAREREVCEQVLAGLSTAAIAGALFISANTVQDHLKAVFDKVGVRSRRELVSRLRADVAPAA